jgi:hypothetical protein
VGEEPKKVDVEKLFKEIIAREKPDAEYWYYETSGFHIIDMPSDHKLHGSSVAFRCDETCLGNGDIVVHPDTAKDIEKLVAEAGCKVIDTHIHGLLYPEAHVHFECVGIREKDVKKILNLVKWL